MLRYQELIDAGRSRIKTAGMDEYLDLGAESRSQNRINRAYMDELVFEMRILGSRNASIETEVLGQRLSTPILTSAFTESRVLETLPWTRPLEYLELIAEGVSDAGSMMMTGAVTMEMLARLVEKGAPIVHIIKPFWDKERIADQLEHAERLGCVAVGMDIDAMYGEKAWDEVPGPDHPWTADVCRDSSILRGDEASFRR